MRTVQSYSRMLAHFFGVAHKTPDHITSPEVFSWAHGIGLSGKRPSSITIGARLACLSSFYKFLTRMGLIAANPCEAIERPRTVPSQPRGLTADDIRKLLAVIPDTPTELRDRAIVLTLTFTGRRLRGDFGIASGVRFRNRLQLMGPALEERTHIAFDEQGVGDAPNRPHRTGVSEGVYHDRSIRDRLKLVGMSKGLKGPTNLLVLEQIRPFESCDSRRQPLLNPEMDGLPRNRIPQLQQTLSDSADCTFFRLRG